MTDILTPSERAKLSEKIAAFRLPWCVPWLASGIRHLMRNCDLDCFEAGHERGAGCERPGMYDGQTIAEVMNAAPRMLATIEDLRADVASLKAANDELQRDSDDRDERIDTQYRTIAAHEATITELRTFVDRVMDVLGTFTRINAYDTNAETVVDRLVELRKELEERT